MNVQVICDKLKQFLWSFPSNKGSTHDAAAFKSSRLYSLLQEKSQELYDGALFIVGDTVYGLAPFLQVSYSKGKMKQDNKHAKDSYNYFLSSSRIFIKCAFGELIMRWGIFWRTLRFDLKNVEK